MNTKEEEEVADNSTHSTATPRLNAESTAVGLSLFRGQGYGIPVHSKGVSDHDGT